MMVRTEWRSPVRSPEGVDAAFTAEVTRLLFVKPNVKEMGAECMSSYALELSKDVPEQNRHKRMQIWFQTMMIAQGMPTDCRRWLSSFMCKFNKMKSFLRTDVAFSIWAGEQRKNLDCYFFCG